MRIIYYAAINLIFQFNNAHVSERAYLAINVAL